MIGKISLKYNRFVQEESLPGAGIPKGLEI
jgi:hypothetical protein